MKYAAAMAEWLWRLVQVTDQEVSKFSQGSKGSNPFRRNFFAFCCFMMPFYPFIPFEMSW
jgi:hypothetical protein